VDIHQKCPEVSILHLGSTEIRSTILKKSELLVARSLVTAQKALNCYAIFRGVSVISQSKHPYQLYPAKGKNKLIEIHAHLFCKHPGHFFRACPSRHKNAHFYWLVILALLGSGIPPPEQIILAGYIGWLEYLNNSLLFLAVVFLPLIKSCWLVILVGCNTPIIPCTSW
jgi:hypothetical protein